MEGAEKHLVGVDEKARRRGGRGREGGRKQGGTECEWREERVGGEERVKR